MMDKALTDVLDAHVYLQWMAIQELEDRAQFDNGKFWQGLETHSKPPADGQLAPADKLETEAAPGEGTWAEENVIPASAPFSVKLDEYDGPRGAGYVATFRVEVAGEFYQKRMNHGPEVERATQGWEPERSAWAPI